MPYIRKAAAIVVGPLDQNVNSHAEVAGMALDIPVIVCNAKVVDFIPAHSLITVDAEKGYCLQRDSEGRIRNSRNKLESGFKSEKSDLICFFCALYCIKILNENMTNEMYTNDKQTSLCEGIIL